MSTGPILFVDDDPEILASTKRAFRKRYTLITAQSPAEALRIMTREKNLAVIVSDLRMPGMDGVEFLEKARKHCPTAVRVMLTGYADVQSAAAAVNAGKVFSFLTKPCPEEELTRALDAALAQHRLLVAERELIRGTVRGSVKLLTDMLSLVNPQAFGKSTRVRRLAVDIGRYMAVPDLWRLDLAAMLSQLGCAALPQELLQKVARGQELTTQEAEQFAAHPVVGRDLVANIPRLREVAEIIGLQERRFDGSGPAAQGGSAPAGVDIPLAARILKVALDFDTLENAAGSGPVDHEQALAELRSRSGWYDPAVLDALDSMVRFPEGYEPAHLPVAELKPGMILDETLRPAGRDELPKGMELNRAVIQRLRNALEQKESADPVRVLVPSESKLLLRQILDT